MATHPPCSRARVDHYRQLADFVSDERAHRALMDMAREMEEQLVERDAAPRPFPRSLS